MRTINIQSLLQIVTFILFAFNTAFTYASMNDEHKINEIIKNQGKENLVTFIHQRRNGKITIQKNKSFLNITGKPNLSLITTKSIIQDLKIIQLDISKLKAELDAHIKNKSKKQQEELSNLASINESQDTLRSNKLKKQIQKLNAKYRRTDSVSERKKIKKERNTKKSNGSSYCDSIKAQLRKLTEPDYRHKIFYCSERSYRVKNPDLCDQSRYVKQYTIEEHKDEVRKLRLDASNNCKS